jgi:hypothetical protein
MPYYMSRKAALNIANYLSTYQNDNDDSCEIASALFALVNRDEESIVLANETSQPHAVKLREVIDLHRREIVEIGRDQRPVGIPGAAQTEPNQ